MSIRTLEVFIEVYLTQSITQASKNLFICQPAVTRTIQGIERKYNILLFTRKNKEIVPTQYAHELYNYAVKVVNDYNKMDGYLSSLSDCQTINLGVCITIANIYLSQILSILAEKYPHKKVKTYIENLNSLIEKLENNEIDTAIIEGTTQNNKIITSEFAESRYVLTLPVNHPLATKEKILLKDIIPYNIILREKESGARIYLNSIFEKYNLDIEPSIESTSTEAILSNVSQGLGISIMPYVTANKYSHEKKIAIREFEDVRLTRTYCVASNKVNNQSSLFNSIVKICNNVVKQSDNTENDI